MKKVLVSGSTGFIGSYLIPYLYEQGFKITHLVRRKGSTSESEIFWDPLQETIEDISKKEIDLVIHLAGESIATGRWTKQKKMLIRNSRVKSTHFLSRELSELKFKPKLLICASAIGYYGDRGSELLNEKSDPGEGFLAQVCQEWEAATKPAVEAGIRVIHLRFGIILSPKQGALAKMLPAFKAGLGGKIGDGKQYMSWIIIQEVLSIIKFTIDMPQLSGPINAVSPSPVTNEEFSKCLGDILNKPVIFTLPTFLLKTTLGEMAQELLLVSARVTPQKLLESGYVFQHDQLDAALRSLLSR